MEARETDLNRSRGQTVGFADDLRRGGSTDSAARVPTHTPFLDSDDDDEDLPKSVSSAVGNAVQEDLKVLQNTVNQLNGRFDAQAIMCQQILTTAVECLNQQVSHKKTAQDLLEQSRQTSGMTVSLLEKHEKLQESITDMACARIDMGPVASEYDGVAQLAMHAHDSGNEDLDFDLDEAKKPAPRMQWMVNEVTGIFHDDDEDASPAGRKNQRKSGRKSGSANMKKTLSDRRAATANRIKTVFSGTDSGASENSVEQQIKARKEAKMLRTPSGPNERKASSTSATGSVGTGTFRGKLSGAALMEGGMENISFHHVDPAAKPEAMSRHTSGDLAEKASHSGKMRKKHPSHHHHGAEMPVWREKLAEFAESTMFEVASAIVIITHSMFIGAYVEYMSVVSMKGHLGFRIGNMFLTFCFFMEVVIKFLAEGKQYFTGDERKWNWFDLILLAIVFIEVVLQAAVSGEAKKKAKKVLKIVEMMRTGRVLRIFRFLKFSTTLSVIISQIFHSMASLGWILVMCSMMIFAMSVCLTTGSLYILHPDGQNSIDPAEMTSNMEDIKHYFGTVHSSLFTTFSAMGGGLDWAGVVESMHEMGWVYQAMFIVFIAFFTVAMLNIITGIFVDNAGKADDELDEERNRKREAARAHQLKLFYMDFDLENDGKISLNEFVELQDDPGMIKIMRDLKIPNHDAASLFRLLDTNCNGELDVTEFVSGLLHLKGQSTSLDVAALLYECRQIKRLLISHAQFSKMRLMDITQKVNAVDRHIDESDKKAESRHSKYDQRIPLYVGAARSRSEEALARGMPGFTMPVLAMARSTRGANQVGGQQPDQAAGPLSQHRSEGKLLSVSNTAASPTSPAVSSSTRPPSINIKDTSSPHISPRSKTDEPGDWLQSVSATSGKSESVRRKKVKKRSASARRDSSGDGVPDEA
jgi:hypothetical protein